MNLEGGTCAVHYCGVILWDKFNDMQSVIQSKCYKKWDESAEAPPKTRPQESAPSREIALEVLAFNPSRDKPVWPEVLNNRFVDGPEKALLKELKDAFEREFGRATSDQSQVQTSRVVGSCDFGFDGAVPLDTDRIIEPAFVPAVQVPAERQVVKPDMAFSCILSFGLFPVIQSFLPPVNLAMSFGGLLQPSQKMASRLWCC